MTLANWIHPLLFSGSDPYAGYFVYETFTDDDGVILPNHNPEMDAEGGGWINQFGIWDINTNQAALHASAGDGQCNAVIDAGVADCQIDCQLNLFHKDAGLILRSQDNNNYLMIATVAPQQWHFYEKVAAGYNILISFNPLTVQDTAYVFRITMLGDTFNVWLDGVPVLVDYVCARFQTETEHGLRIFSVTDGLDGTFFNYFHISAL